MFAYLSTDLLYSNPNLNLNLIYPSIYLSIYLSIHLSIYLQCNDHLRKLKAVLLYLQYNMLYLLSRFFLYGHGLILGLWKKGYIHVLDLIRTHHRHTHTKTQTHTSHITHHTHTPTHTHPHTHTPTHTHPHTQTQTHTHKHTHTQTQTHTHTHSFSKYKLESALQRTSSSHIVIQLLETMKLLKQRH